VRTIRDLERGHVQHPRPTSIALLADALAVTSAERAAFTNFAADLAVYAGAPRRPVPVPSQLPADIGDFTGRDLALEKLYSRVRSHKRHPAVVITAVVGKAGVGKTTLAVHAVHQLRALFPDGQLYVNLRGAETQALNPADVLSGFLRAFGVESNSVPDDADERARLYRSVLADRQVLVLLDNAASEEQVRPLLPAGAGNLVMITSRARLHGLAATEVIDLGVLPPEQAVELLGKIVGDDRVAREPQAARAIAQRCGYLPLALRIAGARLAAKPHWRLQRLAARLDSQHRRLDELTAGDLEVRASFGLSYQGLGEPDRRAFRLLGLLEVPDFAPWMLSALVKVPAAEAEDIAERLADAQLLDTIGEDLAGQMRYRFHDLLRLYARERLAEEETATTRHAALERTLQAYFAKAQESVHHLRLRPPELPGQVLPAVPHDAVVTLTGSCQWLAAEYMGLTVSLDQSWRERLGPLGQAVARLLTGFFEVYACSDRFKPGCTHAYRADPLK
jgi:hypothetical protein